MAASWPCEFALGLAARRVSCGALTRSACDAFWHDRHPVPPPLPATNPSANHAVSVTLICSGAVMSPVEELFDHITATRLSHPCG